MLATRCVNGKIIGLTNHKQELLDNEYSEFNRLTKFINEADKVGMDEYCEYSYVKDKFNIYSLTKCCALRNCINSNHEQPLIIHNQSVKVVVNDNYLTSLWVRIGVYGKRGGIWLPIKTGSKGLELINTCKTMGIKIIKKNNIYYVSITIQKEVQEISYSNILAIDLGEKTIATVSGTAQEQPLFLGRNVRGIRRHYAWLRKKLGNKKLLKEMKKIKHNEKNKVDSILHEISKKIIDISVASNSIIVLGDLKGIRNSAKKKGKRMNRIVSNMPYHKLTQMITYKAKWKGIRVVKINEAYTSITCNKCGHNNKDNRKSQGLFKCKECGWEVNADYNACLNIINRSLDYKFSDGAPMLKAQNSSKNVKIDDLRSI